MGLLVNKIKTAQGENVVPVKAGRAMTGNGATTRNLS